MRALPAQRLVRRRKRASPARHRDGTRNLSPRGYSWKGCGVATLRWPPASPANGNIRIESF